MFPYEYLYDDAVGVDDVCDDDGAVTLHINGETSYAPDLAAWGNINGYEVPPGYVDYPPEAQASDDAWNRMHRYHADVNYFAVGGRPGNAQVLRLAYGLYLHNTRGYN